MPMLEIYIDDRTLEILRRYGEAHDRTVDDLAECAVAESALAANRHMPDAMPDGWTPRSIGTTYRRAVPFTDEPLRARAAKEQT